LKFIIIEDGDILQMAGCLRLNMKIVGMFKN
jgi:hypothetical protein